MASSVESGRAAFDRRQWRDSLAAFSAAAAAGDHLEPGDHERRAIAAYLAGDDAGVVAGLEAAERAFLDAGDAPGAARCAFWLAFHLMIRGEMAQAGGWLARTERLIEEHGLDCPASGYVLVPRILEALGAGDAPAARDLATRAADVAHRHRDPDLGAFATLGHGQALLAMGDVAGGTSRLDEVMVSVAASEVGPVTTGIVYCAVILECMALLDIRRASEWTGALTEWCAAQPDLVPYRGQCLVHRSQLQQAAGAWRDAIGTVRVACERLADPLHPALGLAYYQQAELHRLVGNVAEAEASYRLAARHGHDPMPGLALLTLAQGDSAAAADAVRRALHERRPPGDRPALLAGAVDVLLEAGDVGGARAAAEELRSIAAAPGAAPALKALAAQAVGAVLVGEGDPAGGLVELRSAAAAWQGLRMPYEAARVAVLVGQACAALGDAVSTTMELENARETFAALGAGPDLDRLAAVTGESGRHRSRTELSARERQVLALVAAGRTNREIATELVISQHTVGRHLENIFAKIGVRTRAAATAYAYEHDLL